MYLNNVSRYSSFDYFVVSRRGSEPEQVEKRCNSEKEAVDYVKKYGKQDYKGNYHGCTLTAIEVEHINITRRLA